MTGHSQELTGLRALCDPSDSAFELTEASLIQSFGVRGELGF